MTPESSAPDAQRPTPNAEARPWLPYVAPMALFVLLTYAEGQIPKAWYVGAYVAKVLFVTGALVACRAAWRDLKWEPRVLPVAVVVGLLVFVEWVGLERALNYPRLGERVGFNPFAEIPNPGLRAVFLAARFYGLALMVPLMEELFWRSFLLRYLTAEFESKGAKDWRGIPIGTFAWSAFWAVAALFALIHPEWLVAFLCAVSYGLLLRATRSLLACVVAHAVTNLALGVYVLVARDWRFW